MTTIGTIITFVLCIAPLIVYGVATTRQLKDYEKDNFEYKQPKNIGDF